MTEITKIVTADDFILPDCPTEMPRLGRSVVPKVKLHLINADVNPKVVNRSKKENTENSTSTPRTNEALKETIECDEKRKIITESRKDSSSRITNLSPQRISRRVSKKKILDEFLFLGERKGKRHSSKEMMQRFKVKNMEDIIFAKTTNHEENNYLPEITVKEITVPRFKSIAVQTEPMNDFDLVNEEKNSKQMSFFESVAFLNKNIVDQVLKIKGHTFRIDECAISLSMDNENIKTKEKLIIQPTKMLSSCLLLLDSLREYISVSELRKTEEETATSSQEYSENNAITDLDDDKSPIISEDSREIIHAKKTEDLKEKTPVLNSNKEVRVLLHKLPESLVKAALNGNKLKVTTKKKEELEHEVAVETSENSAFDPKALNSANSAKVGNTTISKICSEDPLKDIEPNSKTNDAIIQVNEFHCDMCNKKFKFYQSLRYHKEIQHKMSADHRVECYNHDVFYEALHFDIVHGGDSPETDESKSKQTCPECFQVLSSKMDLENHLLKDHHIVLKKDVYQCDACPKKFITYKSLMYHSEKAHNIATIEDVVFKQNCDICNKLVESHIYKNRHLYECTMKHNEEGKRNSDDSADPMAQIDAVIQGTSSVRKRKSSIKSSGNFDMKTKRRKLVGESSMEESNGILNKLEALIGVNDGPNKITIVNLN